MREMVNVTESAIHKIRTIQFITVDPNSAFTASIKSTIGTLLTPPILVGVKNTHTPMAEKIKNLNKLFRVMVL